MTQVMSMSSGAIDPIAVAKRVFWRPVTEATLKVGQPVCYSSDSIYDYQGRSVDPVHLGLTRDTYAEGEQEKTARLLVVEEPLTANLNAFAGIVKCLGPKAGADGDFIEIWIPNGAVLPCYIDQSVTLDETILGIRDGEADVSYPGNGVTNPGRPIGVAKETIDRGTPGMCWVKIDPNMFSCQYGVSDSAYLKVDGGSAVNKKYVEIVDATPVIGFLNDSRLLYDGIMTEGQLTVANDFLHFTGSNTAAAASYIRGGVSLVHLDGCTLNSASLVVAGFHAQLGGTPAAFTACSKACALWVDVGVKVNPTAGTYSMIYVSENSDGAYFCDTVFDFYVPRTDYFAKFDASAEGGAHHCIYAMTGDHTTGATDRALKCDIGGTTYYIPLYDGLGV